MTQNLNIAPGVQAADWHNLELDDPKGECWKRAIQIFRARISDRYLDPVRILIDLDEGRKAVDRRFGFTILAIDSLLVETLWAFKQGLLDTNHRSGRAFKEFLTSEISFGFSEHQAEIFYGDYRCGILHQAEIDNSSRVWSVGPLVHSVQGQLVINRTLFHDALTKSFEAYCEQLSDSDNMELRDNFRKKMNHISRANHYGE